MTTSLTTPSKIRDLRSKLYRKAKNEPGYRFYMLYDKIFREDILAHAYERARANKGAPGVDGQGFEDIESRGLAEWLTGIRQELRNKTYQPQPVRPVMIPKPGGGERPLGIPTVSDRIAQMVVKSRLEPAVDPLFHPDSNGYRPGKSALDAVGQARQRCWRHDWIIDLDIKGFFDNIPQDLLMRAVKKHAKHEWVVLYIERWLKAPVQEEDGRLVPREKGTPQGGVMTA